MLLGGFGLGCERYIFLIEKFFVGGDSMDTSGQPRGVMMIGFGFGDRNGGGVNTFGFR